MIALGGHGDPPLLHQSLVAMGGSLIPIVVIGMGMLVSHQGRDALATMGMVFSLTNRVSWFLVDFLSFLFYCGADNRFIAWIKETYE